MWLIREVENVESAVPTMYQKVTQIHRNRSLKILIHKTSLTFKYNDRHISIKFDYVAFTFPNASFC